MAALGTAGKRLHKQIIAGLGKDWELDEREAEILRLACRQADDLHALEAAIRKHGVLTNGSQGQMVLAPWVTEARQARSAVSRLLGLLALPDSETEPRTAAGRRGQKAANKRWDREREKWGDG